MGLKSFRFCYSRESLKFLQVTEAFKISVVLEYINTVFIIIIILVTVKNYTCISKIVWFDLRRDADETFELKILQVNYTHAHTQFTHTGLKHWPIGFTSEKQEQIVKWFYPFKAAFSIGQGFFFVFCLFVCFVPFLSFSQLSFQIGPPFIIPATHRSTCVLFTCEEYPLQTNITDFRNQTRSSKCSAHPTAPPCQHATLVKTWNLRASLQFWL